MHMTKKQQMIGLAGWFIVCFIVAALGSIASIQAGEFYNQLQRPSWAPPASIFGPMWSLLYAMMAVSAWLVWRVAGFKANQKALTLFIVQLVVNGFWSWFFFAWQMGAGSFLNIVILWILIVATIVAFWRIQQVAAILLLPYLLWVTFATALNYSVWQANPLLL